MPKNYFAYSTLRFLVIYITWWIVWSFVQLVVLIKMGLVWQTALTDSAISSVLLALVCLSAIQVSRFYQPGTGNRLYRLVLALSVTWAYCFVLNRVLQYYFLTDMQYLNFVKLSMPVRFVFALLMISFVGVLNWLLKSLEEQKAQQIRQSESVQLSKDAELIKLRQQLQPHFLFNSLNSISALAISNPKEARKMIQQLSDFLRGTLKKDEQKTVMFKEEIEHLNLYLEIEKVRFGQRLSVQLKISEDTLFAKIPPLLLQPIVENAIKFGLYGTIDNIEIVIEASVSDGLLQLKIINPFDENSQPESKGTGFGLSSIQRRLFLMYSRNDLLSIESVESVFTTKLIIPQIS